LTIRSRKQQNFDADGGVGRKRHGAAAETRVAKLFCDPVGLERKGGEPDKTSVRKIMIDDLAKVRALLGHGPCATLAESDTVSLANALQNDLRSAFMRLEIVARDRVPTKPPVHRQPPGFTMIRKNRGVFPRETAAPTNGIFVAEIANNGEIRIPAGRDANIGGRKSMAPAAAGKHGRHSFFVKGNYEVSRRFRSDRGWAAGSRRFL
jgi:hypothetical protein